jgi:hypothetical protein
MSYPAVGFETIAVTHSLEKLAGYLPTGAAVHDQAARTLDMLLA